MIQKIFKPFKVQQKIILGYGLSIGISLLGTLLGFTLGDLYQRQSWKELQHSQIEINLLYRLQFNLVESRKDQQQLLSLLFSPIAYKTTVTQLEQHLNTSKAVYRELEEFLENREHFNTFHHSMFDKLQRNYNNYFFSYERNLKQILNTIKIDKVTTLETREDVETLILRFNRSLTVQKFDRLTDEIVNLMKISYEEQKQSENKLKQAERVRFQIIIASILISLGISITFAIYISHTILHPLEEMNKITQEVTETANFKLQIPLQTKDEIATLAHSFNTLITKVNSLLKEQQKATSEQLVQSEKMSSLGQMVAGIAHEINNPVNFIYGNLSHADNYIHDLFELINTYKAENTTPSEKIIALEEDIDYEFLTEDLPKLLQSMKVGADRARQIVLSLRNFSRLDDQKPNLVNIHDCLESTLLILNNRLKKGIEVHKDFGEIPMIEGYSGLLYQVFMNLISNSIDAVEASPNNHKKITITTYKENNHSVIITIKDNGIGIPKDIQSKIFDTFFTTKPIGVGTGLGLSIVSQIIKEKHHGEIDLVSQENQETEFKLLLPIAFSNH